jgi:hypothetical protein
MPNAVVFFKVGQASKPALEPQNRLRRARLFPGRDADLGYGVEPR